VRKKTKMERMMFIGVKVE